VLITDGRTDAFNGVDAQKADDRSAIGLSGKKHVRTDAVVSFDMLL
jgi:hypothetical protein